MNKYTIIVAALVVFLGGAVVYKMRAQQKSSSPIGILQQVPESTVTTTTNVTATTDSDLDKDSAGVSTKLKVLNDDSANIDAGLNDKQGNLNEE